MSDSESSYDNIFSQMHPLPSITYPPTRWYVMIHVLDFFSWVLNISVFKFCRILHLGVGMLYLFSTCPNRIQCVKVLELEGSSEMV